MSAMTLWTGLALLAVLSQGAAAVTPKIAAGWNTFALKNDGTLVAMGNDAQGQLGLGRTRIFASPVQAVGLTQVRTLAAGANHSVALRADGTVWTWGHNFFGQLGDGTNVSSTQPSRVPNLDGVTGIAAGFTHTLASKQDGTVWAWGSNLNGQVGGVLPLAVVPVQVAGLSGVTMVAAQSDGSHNLALKSDGTVWAWGANSQGQLGDGTTTDRGAPVQVPGLTNVVWIAAGYQHSLAARTDGTVWAWGWNQYGQLGDGTTIGRSTPVLVNGLSTTSLYVLAAGAEHSMAVTADTGTVWVWGANGTGQLGDGTTTDHPMPVRVEGFSNVVSFAAGSYHNLVVKPDGSLWAWGTNFYAELGDGTTTSRRTPVQVPGMTGMADAAASLVHTLTLKQDGTVWAWGLNEYGQLGIGSAEIVDHSVPIAVPGISGVTDISASPFHTVALKQDGTVWAWGSNLAGQLGDGTNTDRTTPMQTEGLAGVAAVGAGGFFSLALKQDGTVWAWGYNDYGQLGDGTNVNRSTPARVQGLSGTFIAIAAGNNFALAVRQDGTVWAWGANSYGQLGDGTTTNRNMPVQVAGIGGVAAVSAGIGHSVALKTDGTVWAWGYNFYGQLGDASETDRYTPVQAQGLAGATGVSAGLSHTIAVISDGAVWTWGSNVFGELGSGAGSSGSTPLPVPGLAGVIAAVVSTVAHSVALKQDGTVWTWGSNVYGQLGDGTYVSKNVPVLAVNETVNGFLDLVPEVANSIPADKIPPFLVATYKYGGATATSLAVDLRALAAGGAFQAAGNFAAAYNVYVAASVPLGGATLLFQLDSANRWSTLSRPMAQYLSGVALDSQNAVVKAQILQNADVSQLVGASLYVGYGTDPDEMILNSRYRAVFTVPSQ